MPLPRPIRIPEPGSPPCLQPALPAVPPPPSPAAAPPPSRGLILLVDDSAVVRSLLGRFLTSQGFEVIGADSGLHGLAAWDRRKPDVKLVVSDVFMPGMDGLTFARELRRRAQSLPIVLMSGQLDEDSRWVAEEAGFHLVAKPFKDADLLALVQRLLGAAST